MARRKRDESEPPGIVVMYTSLMILLLAFFIMLNTLSKVEEAKVRSALQSLRSTFGFTPGGMSALKSEAFNATFRANAPINPVEQDYMALRTLVQDEDLGDDAKLLRSGGLHTVAMTSALLFKPGSLELSDQAMRFLDQVAKIVGRSKYPLSLRGHTDRTGATQRERMELFNLSAQRALAVVYYLIGQGVDPARLAAFGLSGYWPMVGENAPNRAVVNNRVELVFDARDAAQHMLPEAQEGRRLNFKGFTFDLLKEVPVEKPAEQGP